MVRLAGMSFPTRRTVARSPQPVTSQSAGHVTNDLETAVRLGDPQSASNAGEPGGVLRTCAGLYGTQMWTACPSAMSLSASANGCGMLPCTPLIPCRAVSCRAGRMRAAECEPHSGRRVRPGQGGIPGLVHATGAARQGCGLHHPAEDGGRRPAVAAWRSWACPAADGEQRQKRLRHPPRGLIACDPVTLARTPALHARGSGEPHAEPAAAALGAQLIYGQRKRVPAPRCGYCGAAEGERCGRTA